ncbi:dihydrofolate reductase [Malassezia vespertilionis]|uniref:Serine hydrolase domain-containing protein n=1 Tax=Malassezia vespertilionis TaxID=2020962 RepID=A0A2N1J6X0_9BASI|nr:dihydrofolate reductase [Malassezia vespertilionis]PKI82300.1 hypothetical protein MVES_003777 [Malassezia vespertilionis]WFD07945.1 dihydrofolate reductase [Malassezia vespertilionis]
MASIPKLKVLVIHGYATNGAVFKRRTSALQKACRDVAEFVFVNGPLHVRALPSASNPEPGEPNPADPVEKQARAWWRHDGDVYRGWDNSAMFLQTVFQEHGPFDGIMGFSQGGSVTAVITAALEHPSLVPEMHGKFQELPFKFAINISGFRPADQKFDALFEPKIATPMLIIIGMNDFLVEPKTTETLLSICEQSRIVHHDGGHYLPTNASWRNFLRDFIDSFRVTTPSAWQDIPAPLMQLDDEITREEAEAVDPKL